MLKVEEGISKLFMDQIENLDYVNLEEIIDIMLEIKQDGEKI